MSRYPPLPQLVSRRELLESGWLYKGCSNIKPNPNTLSPHPALAYIYGRGYWHTLCVPLRDYWHTPPEIEPMKVRVCANCSFVLLAHTLSEGI